MFCGYCIFHSKKASLTEASKVNKPASVVVRRHGGAIGLFIVMTSPPQALQIVRLCDPPRLASCGCAAHHRSQTCSASFLEGGITATCAVVTTSFSAGSSAWFMPPTCANTLSSSKLSPRCESMPFQLRSRLTRCLCFSFMICCMALVCCTASTTYCTNNVVFATYVKNLL